MADPLTVIIRFSGDPDDLLERFERARRMWIEAQDGDYERPVYAACTTDEGIAAAIDHRLLHGEGMQRLRLEVGRAARDISGLRRRRYEWRGQRVAQWCSSHGRGWFRSTN